MYFLSPNLEKYDFLEREEWNSIENSGNNACKIIKMTELLKITADELDAKRKLCPKLLRLLKKFYPDCLLFDFGSCINGLGMKHCEFDILFLPFPGYCNLDYAHNNMKPIVRPNPLRILTGRSSRRVLLQLSETSHLYFIRSIVKHEKILVATAKVLDWDCLKIKFVNDVVFNLVVSNKIVIFHSELLHFLQKLDVRVQPLVLVLRYWAKSIGIIRKDRLTCYAFTMLVIFFLQNTSPPVLPSVQHLIEISKYSRMVCGWQTAFASDVNLVSKSKNTEKIDELFMYFFHFYWNFDFFQYIVSPYKGRPVCVKYIKNSEDKSAPHFRASTVSIQDPFAFTHNLSKRFDSHSIFKVALFTAYQMLLNKNGKFKFSTLFDPSEYDRIYNLQFYNYLIMKPNIVFIDLDYECFANVCSSSNNLQAWYEKACEAIFDVLQYALLIECEIIDKICWECKMSSMDKDDDKKSQSSMPIIDLNDNSDAKNTLFELEGLLSLQCTVYSRTWVGRKHYTRDIKDESEEFSHPILKAEYNISKSIIEKDPDIASHEPLFHFKCDCFKNSSPQVPGIIISFKPYNQAKNYNDFAIWINIFLPKTVKRILSSDK